MPTKKTTKSASVKKTAAKKTVAPVAAPVEHVCTCGGHCGCGCHGHFFKKFLILLLVFLLGCLCAGYFCKPHMPKHRTIYDDNGCVVLDSIKCPKMLDALANADVDANGCITREEFRAVKKALHTRVSK